MKKLLLLGLMLLVVGLGIGTSAHFLAGEDKDLKAQTAVGTMSEEEKVDYLINFLRNLPEAVFIRNGKEFSPGEAANHLNSKWEKHKKKVKTALGFVNELATVSKTKEPYQIRFNDGHTVKCGDLLNQELQKIEH